MQVTFHWDKIAELVNVVWPAFALLIGFALGNYILRFISSSMYGDKLKEMDDFTPRREPAPAPPVVRANTHGWACRYCGQPAGGGTCSHCGAPQS